MFLLTRNMKVKHCWDYIVVIRVLYSNIAETTKRPLRQKSDSDSAKNQPQQPRRNNKKKHRSGAQEMEVTLAKSLFFFFFFFYYYI